MSVDLYVALCRKQDVTTSDEKVLALAQRLFGKLGADRAAAIDRTGRKPRLCGGGPAFSVTHSGDYWVCAFADFELGIDLQQHQRCKSDAVARRFFHPEEVAWMQNWGEDGFFRIWTAKESFVKYTGEGITDRFSSFSVVDASGAIERCEGAHLRYLPCPAGYTLCLCTPEPPGTIRIFED